MNCVHEYMNTKHTWKQVCAHIDTCLLTGMHVCAHSADPPPTHTHVLTQADLCRRLELGFLSLKAHLVWESTWPAE